MTSSFQKSLLLIGAGAWGKNLARNFYDLGALHTLCDTNAAKQEHYLSLYPDVIFTTNYAMALKDPAITKVAIAAPAAAHYTLAKQALEAGKDVFVEKPLCLNSAEGEELVSLAAQKGSILMVGHLLQYHACIQHLQELIAQGQLGKVQYIAASRLNLGNVRTEENALWSFAPHDISILLSLCGNALPAHVQCFGDSYLSTGVADLSMTTIDFANGVKAHLHVSWLHPFKEQKLVVVGSMGMAVFDDLKPWKEKLALYRNPISWVEGRIPKANECLPEFPSVEQSEPLHNECIHFLACCQSRKTPKTDGAEGLRVLKVLQAAQSSLMQHGIAVPLLAAAVSNYFAHPSAVIDAGAVIGEDANIWHFSHIMDHAVIGPKCNIGQNVVVSPKVCLGRNVKVQNNVSLYTGVMCEDDVFVGPSVVFTNVINPRSAINRRQNYQKTLVKRGASIGANATIVCGVELGEYCFIGAGAVVTKNVKPYALVVGNPARQIGWISSHGATLDLPLQIEGEEEISAVCPLSGENYVLKKDRISMIVSNLTQNSEAAQTVHAALP